MATVVTSLQLESVLKQQPPGPLYLIVGEEDLLRDVALATIKAAVLGESGDFNYDLFYGDEAGGTDILTCALEMPVFAARRLIVVKIAEKLPARASEVLLGYLAEPVETTTLVFVSPKLDGRLKFSHSAFHPAISSSQPDAARVTLWRCTSSRCRRSRPSTARRSAPAAT